MFCRSTFAVRRRRVERVKSLIGPAGCLGLLLIAAATGPSLAASRSILVHVLVPPLPWNVSVLEPSLVRHLSRHQNGQILTTSPAAVTTPDFSDGRYCVDSLSAWGERAGAQYLLMVEVDKETLQTRKVFNLPLLCHLYQAYGIIEGEVRLLDVSRRKLLIAESFRVEHKGPRIFQATTDGDVNDPDLHLSAPAKQRFFSELEEKLAGRLARRVANFTRLR